MSHHAAKDGAGELLLYATIGCQRTGMCKQCDSECSCPRSELLVTTVIGTSDYYRNNQYELNNKYRSSAGEWEYEEVWYEKMQQVPNL